MSETSGHTTILSNQAILKILANHLPEWIQVTSGHKGSYFDLALSTHSFEELGWQIYCFPSIEDAARLQYVLQQAIAGALAEYLTRQQVLTPEGLFPVLRQTSTTVTVLLDDGTAKTWPWAEVMPPLSEQAQEQAIAAVVEE